MRPQPKNLTRSAALLLLLMVSTGCGQKRYAGQWGEVHYGPIDRGAQTLMTHSGNGNAMVFAPGAEAGYSYYGSERSLAAEYDRRDGALSVRVPDPYAGWESFPSPSLPTLDRPRVFYSGRDADRYVYPSVDDGRRPLRHHGHHAYPKRRVR